MRENCTYGSMRGRTYPAGASRPTLHPLRSPAVSSPVGGRAVNFGNTIENHDLNDDDYRDGWGRGSSDWQHSDMKDMAYFYVYKLYEQLVEKGNLK